MKARKFRRGPRLRTMSGLARELDGRRYVFLNRRPIHPGWLRSMTYQTLSSFLYGGHLFKAKETQK